MHFIYKITNDINGKIYIGKTGKTIEERFKEHIKSSQLEYKNRPLYDAMNKYGYNHFYVEKIDTCLNNEEASQKEIYWIKYYNSYYHGYNATLGGDGKPTLDLNEKEILKKYSELKSKCAVARYFNVDEKTIRNILGNYTDFVNDIIKSKKIAMIKDGSILHIFDNQRMANLFLGKNIQSSNISKVLLHKRKTAYGYEWKYLAEIA